MEPAGESTCGLSVVIPAYNEERRLETTLVRVSEYLAARGGSYEIVIVDDGSRDKTPEIAARWRQERPCVHVLASPGNRGKGYAVRLGMMEARGDMILFSDADLSTPIEELAKLEQALAEGADIAIGSRGLRASELSVRQPFYREGLGRAFNVFVRLLAAPGIKDTQCGFKLFRREAARAILPLAKVDGWAFDVETLLIAGRLGYRIAEVPVRWMHSGESRVRILRDGPRMMADLMRIRWWAIRGTYGGTGGRRA